ncbi:MAG: acyltransferase [Bacteroidales bacterium]|nr:acyltransferase [Bacteroidales bacterium]
MGKKQIVFVDYLRVIACFLVMLVHASENFYGADASGMAGNVSMLANETNRFWVAFYDGTVARTCVPLFMVVSAFLLVPMKEGQTMFSFYKRRFLRIIPPFIAFQLLYTFIPVLTGAWTWNEATESLWMLPLNFSPMAGHLWFMYPLISLYLIIPIISPWLEKATAKEELAFIGLFAISTFLPWLHQFVASEIWGECFWNGFTMLWYCSGYIGYLVLAHYIRKHLNWHRTKRMAVGLVSFLIGAIFTGWSFWWMGTPGQLIETPLLEWSWAFCTPNVLLATFGAFLMFTCIEQKETPKAIASISRLSFGMYLMHIFFLAPIASWIVNGDQANPLLPVWLAIPVIAMLTFVCCVVTSKLISLIPGSKWIIG